MNKTKGFTIIELIVVVAIIAVLASIVAINVTTYLKKGKDAAIKENLSTLQTAGVAYLEGTPAGTAACSDVTVLAAMTQLGAITTVANTDCASAAGVFAACAQMIVTTGDYWCADSTGNKKQVTGTCSASWNLTACP